MVKVARRGNGCARAATTARSASRPSIPQAPDRGARGRHNARDERTAPPRRHDDVLESDRRRRAPLPADQARLAGRPAALAPFDRGSARRRQRRRRGDAAVDRRCRQRRLSPAAAPGRDRACPRRPRSRPDRGRRPVPRRLGRARRGAAARHPGGRLLPLEHRRDGAARRAAVASARARRDGQSVMRATSTPASISSSRRAAAWRPTSATGASSASPASRSASTRRCSAREARDAGLRARRGWPDDARVLVYAGRFAPEKHLDVLADAVGRLGAPYVLLAVGAGPAPPPASERVVVQPFVASASELATVLASADAFVHAGDQETFGLSVLEAMACGTPAVVRDAEGLGELAGGRRRGRRSRRHERRLRCRDRFALRR